jgi:amidophosphoribosyltransferase
LNHELLPGEKGPQDACGVFGVWAPGEDVAKLTYFGLYALQHRGQESAGIATSDGSQVLVYKDMGLVSQVFNDTACCDSLTGTSPSGTAATRRPAARVGERPTDARPPRPATVALAPQRQPDQLCHELAERLGAPRHR